ncbi:hypothetical protein ACLOJK_009743 [Asimina triloba]
MGKGSRIGCKSASHQLFKDKAKNRVDALQGMFMDLQLARKESRAIDIAMLEEQVHQMLREWKADLNESSPSSSLHGNNSLDSSNLSSDIRRLLQLCEEEDDATSPLAVPTGPKPEPDVLGVQGAGNTVFQELNFSKSLLDCPMVSISQPLDASSNNCSDTSHSSLLSREPPLAMCVHNEKRKRVEYYVNQASQDCGYQEVDHCKGTPSAGLQPSNMINNLDVMTQLEYHQFEVHPDYAQNIFLGFNAASQCGDDVVPHMSTLLPRTCPPPSAFLGPKCALWDCPRPAQGAEWCQDYCSNFHASLAMNEGQPGMSPVLRPRGIDLKDGPLFSALTARTQGKDVGIPECEGAATTKSPWNAPELFDLSVLESGTIREWLFFDKPRRAFESGNRKQRSLPDYSGRGWHESRKQVMKEFGGLKRSYYMDPQPLNNFEWHLYEYEINHCDACALYRLELKLVDAKKSPKGKVSGDSLVDLQNQLGRLSAEFPADNKRSVKGRTKANLKDSAVNALSAPNQMAVAGENVGYGVNVPCSYLVGRLNDYYGT